MKSRTERNNREELNNVEKGCGTGWGRRHRCLLPFAVCSRCPPREFSSPCWGVWSTGKTTVLLPPMVEKSILSRKISSECEQKRNQGRLLSISCHVCLLIPARSSDLYKYLRHIIVLKKLDCTSDLKFLIQHFPLTWIYVERVVTDGRDVLCRVDFFYAKVCVCASASTTMPAHLPGSTRGPACPRRPSIPASQAARRHTPCTPSPCISQKSRSAATRPVRWGSTDTDPPLRRTHTHNSHVSAFFNVSCAVQSDLCH